MSRKFALIVGNSEYEDKNLARLAASGADVRALAEVLRDPEIGGFDEVSTLANQPAKAIRRAIASFFTDKRRDDLLLLYFSGHGIQDDRGQLFLAVQDTEHMLLRATAIPAAYVTEEMDNSRSRRQVLILDCCHSGAFARGVKGAPGTSAGTATAFEGKGFGRVVLTATDATQFAWEGEQVIGQAENSLFTHFLIQGLRTGEADTDADGRITLDELYDYVYEQVVRETPKQTPSKWSYRQQGELVIAQNPHPVMKPVGLPNDLLETIEDPRPWVREGAVHELRRLLQGSQTGLALAAKEMLERMVADDSQRVAGEAKAALKGYAKIQRVGEEKPSQEAGREAGKAGPESKEAGERREGTETGERPGGEGAEQKQEPHPEIAREPDERRQPALGETGAEPPRFRWVEVGSAESESAGQKTSHVERATKETGVRKLGVVLPRWALWVVLLSVGGLSIWLFATWPGLAGKMPTATITRLAAVADETKSATMLPAEVTLATSGPGLPASPPASPDITIEPTSSGIQDVEIIPQTKAPTSTAAPTETSAPPAKATGRIAFVSDRDGNQEIYVMNADGTGLTRLTKNPEGDNDPDWSPDGTRIAFTSFRDGTGDIYVMNADGSGQTRLTKNYGSYDPVWSPNGSRIAFTSFRDEDELEIYVMNADGSGQTRLTNNNGDDLSPIWSPDGTRIAFVSGQDGNDEIYVINADGSGQTRLTYDNALDAAPVYWFPDGTRIAFMSTRLGGVKIFVMNADGSEQKQLINVPVSGWGFTWSPDGKFVAFTSDLIVNSEIYNSEIFVMNADGSGQTRLTDNPATDWHPTWGP